jgi:hypothetical protein
MAFGHDLIETVMTTQLFRKVSGMNFLKDGEHCFSTPSSSALISHGEFCIVLEEKEYSGQYTDKDADAGKDFGYDEFRIEMSREKLLNNIDFIVVPNAWVDSEMDEKASDYLEENDPLVWIDNLAEYARVISEREFTGTMNFNF